MHLCFWKEARGVGRAVTKVGAPVSVLPGLAVHDARGALSPGHSSCAFTTASPVENHCATSSTAIKSAKLYY